MTLTMTRGKYEKYFFGSEIIKREEKTKTVHPKLPYVTSCGKGFPKYLWDYKDYYEVIHEGYWHAFELKKEYQENRPTYEITVNYEVITFIPNEICLELINAKITAYEKRINFLKSLTT